MLRGLVLLAAVLAWLAALFLVHRQYGASAPSSEALANPLVLDAVFDERAPAIRRWTIYLNPKKLAGPEEQSTAFLNQNLAETWMREHEREQRLAENAGALPGEIAVGRMRTEIVRPGPERAEVITTMEIDLPVGLSPSLMQIFGSCRWECTQRLTRLGGLQDVTSLFRIGMGVELAGRAVREGEALHVNLALTRNGEKLAAEKGIFPLQGTGTPQVDLSPFTYRPDLNVGDTWEIGMLDLTNASGKPAFVATQARVVKDTATHYQGRIVGVYEVVAEHDRMRYTAYYSPDGNVLKEHWKLRDFLDLTLILEEEPAAAAKP